MTDGWFKNSRKAKRDAARPRCGFEWPSREDPEHRHVCLRPIGPHGSHGCRCGANRTKTLKGLGQKRT